MPKIPHQENRQDNNVIQKKKAADPSSGSTAVQAAKANTQFIRNRQHAAQRLPALACGCTDPWPCRCGSTEPSEKKVDAYRDALQHLAAEGLTGAPILPELRAMWRRGDTDVVRTVTSRWVIAR